MCRSYYLANFILIIVVPKSGCDLITESGVCVSFLTSRGSNWATARSECAKWGGDLASITNSNEDRLFDSIASVRPTACWIGFNDIEREGEWRWADGTENSFTNWEPGNPSSDKQDCGTKYWLGPKWDDDTCHELKRCYFCSAKGKFFKCILPITYMLPVSFWRLSRFSHSSIEHIFTSVPF